ncbi:MAG: hypothetical protein ACRD2B_01100 [Terriglobia bacterium]
MTESTWWHQHEVLCNEVTNTIQSFYTWKHVHNYVSGNKAALTEMNRNPTFWNISTHALQTTFIITIGRVFDKDQRSHSIQKLLAEMAAHPEYFSRASLERRKREAARGGDVSWLPDYLRDVWEPRTADLEGLRDELNPTIEKYGEIYQPIRHKMFAHNDIAVDISVLLSKSLITDVEKILYELHDMLEAVWQLYMNGREPRLGQQKYDYEERISETTRRVMSSLTISGER